MKLVYRLLFGLHLFVGIGAMAGGLAAIINPLEPLGMPLEPLKNSPFSNYLIPGIILFAIIGLGNILSILTIYTKSKFQGYISGVFGGALMIWIIVQCVMLRAVAFLHVLFFIIGLVQAALASAVLLEKGLFPLNIVIKLYKEMKKEV
ncbi:hypothetical protein [Clostridium sp. UBA4548]|uniref:hypothetical protein n=1 Tax=Clostridium sp. UBA4548 TaxID=1946361 RepID=UPI0025BC307A|nr:hypothetical protein [Clostridium sp. UBA4548]